ncbi:MAG: SDR family NAD(P)-dependent oxidoreductase [Actinomycetota bacterium]|nr:SDR family NAD(P)-dependent oxidoreductase [Actinomycetota bacterium]
MTPRLEGKTAIVTGAGSGIGRVGARRFAAEGAGVAVLDVGADRAAETVELIEADGGEAIALACDVTDEGAVARAVAETVRRFGGVDIAYNNAGGSSDDDGAVHEVAVDEWWRTMRIDLFGTFLVSRFAVRAMLDRPGRGGSIVNTASAAALVGIVGGRSCYSAAKGGVVALTRSMAASYADDGIRANVIAPGGTATDRIRASFARRGKALPTGAGVAPLNEPEDIANAAVFLASDEARTITGIVLPVDGGSTSMRRAPSGPTPADAQVSNGTDAGAPAGAIGGRA